MWRCIGNLAFVGVLSCLSLRGFGKNPGDSTQKKERTPIWITAGIDLSRPVMTLFSQNHGGLEGCVDFRNAKYLAGFNLGYAKRTIRQPNYQIADQGVYGTLGFARSLFPDKGQVLAFGLWTGYSRFSNRADQIRIPLFPGPGQQELGGLQSEYSAFWLEFRGLLRTQLYSWLMLGFDVRLRTLLQSPDKTLPVYFIPGYGLRKNWLSPGITYCIFVQLPFRASRVGKTDQNSSGESGPSKNPAGR
jgi:hypothetical protein